jgi:hypothetical protein
LSIHKGFWLDFLQRNVRGDLLSGLLVKITKKGLTRAGKHPKLSSVYAGRNFPFVVSNKNKRGMYLIL